MNDELSRVRPREDELEHRIRRFLHADVQNRQGRQGRLQRTQIGSLGHERGRLHAHIVELMEVGRRGADPVDFHHVVEAREGNRLEPERAVQRRRLHDSGAIRPAAGKDHRGRPGGERKLAEIHGNQRRNAPPSSFRRLSVAGVHWADSAVEPA